MENIERVAALLGESGVETVVRNHQAWRAASWKRFSYTSRNDSEAWPQVWAVRAEQYTRAREVLRDAGLEPATRFADELAAARAAGEDRGHRAAGWRWKALILAAIVAVLVMIALRLGA